jgi:hypothetical protein
MGNDHMRTTIILFVLSILIAIAPGVAFAASNSALPLDVQCWQSMGLTDNPPPGSLAALVEQCVKTLQFQELERQNIEERELRKAALLARARVQAKYLARAQRRIVQSMPSDAETPQAQSLPSTAERKIALNQSRIMLQRRRQWANVPDELRAKALTINREAARNCLVRTDIAVDACVRQIVESSSQYQPEPSELPQEYRDQKQVTLTLNQQIVTSEGVTMQLLRVVSDSRCLQGAECLWSGEATVSVRVYSDEMVRRSADLTLQAPHSFVIPRTEPHEYAPASSANTVSVGRCTIAFARLLPYPSENTRVLEETPYVATFVIMNPGKYFSCAPSVP